jgi:hypothetical protein
LGGEDLAGPNLSSATKAESTFKHLLIPRHGVVPGHDAHPAIGGTIADATKADEIVEVVAKSKGKRSPKWLQYLALAIAAVVPIVLITVGIYGFTHVRHEQSLLQPIPGGVLTTGTVVGSHEYCYRGCTWEPVVRFSDRTGNVYTFIAPYQDAYPALGSKVQVSYNANVPGQAHDISNDPSSWDFELFTMIFVLCLAGLWLLIAAIVAVSLWRKRANASAAPNTVGE